MTGSLIVTGSGAGFAGREHRGSGYAVGRAGDAVHAVARPVVDGLEGSVCGVLVTVSAAVDWPTAAAAPRCEECARIAG
ncbi:hypothetical protein [Blastococcus atacamensis]|uniref:hypothetical protein n=1 Tax=Blastococcus atacamensis TaxID=2070508 RepID=UPI000CEC7C52|nr:hypothetical protein [Blastococcus atacamensis]